MKSLKTVSETAELVAKIEAQLDRLNWLATASAPCYFLVEASEELPNGWVKVFDDHGEVFGDAEEVFSALESQQEVEEDGYGECLNSFSQRKPDSSRSWPEELIEIEQLEAGEINENPLCLIAVGTNTGIRFVAGWHGVSQCALEDWLDAGEPFSSDRETALQSAR